MKRVVAWQRVDTPGLEYAEIDLNPLQMEGHVVLFDEGEPCAVTYSVLCDGADMTTQSTIAMKRGGASQECRLERSGEGRWKMNGIEVPRLKGLADVDLSVTPATNTAPIRRLRLGVGQSAEVTAAWVKFPTLEVVPLRQTYRRVQQNLYQYQAPELGFAAELECDEDGIIQRYGGLWKRVS